ncbi:MAG TPA: hypothetical protein VFR87_09245 [Nocardioidaceae bacterium]|nr:hypothetical protein [Nocardioidaceae bacterium]
MERLAARAGAVHLDDRDQSLEAVDDVPDLDPYLADTEMLGPGTARGSGTRGPRWTLNGYRSVGWDYG